MADSTVTCIVVFADGTPCGRGVRAKGLCSTCYDWSRNNGGADPGGRPRRRRNGELLAFLKTVATATTNECVMASGFTGRPKATYNGRQMWCARIVWIMAHGDPGPAQVLHTCHQGDEGCVNIRHLYLGDHDRNMADKMEAERQARGSRQGHSILTETDVRKIRTLLTDGRPQAAVARQFGVSRAAVSDIVHGRNWAWLE